MGKPDEKLDTIIGKNAFFKGDIKTKGGLRIDGTVEGSIEATDTFVAGNSAYIKGNIKCKDAFIGGKIEGNIHSKGKIEIKSGAYLEGDIVCKGLIVEDNVYFNGRCTMSEKFEREEKQR